MHFGLPAQGTAWANLNAVAAGETVRVVYRQPPMSIISDRNANGAVIAADSALDTTAGIRDYPPQLFKTLRAAVLLTRLQTQRLG